MTASSRILPTDFVLHQVQASAFAAEDAFRPSSILAEVLRDWPDVYNGELLSIPLPQDVPMEVPSVIVPSQDESLRLQAARARVDLFWYQRDGLHVEIEETLNTFADRLATICEKNEVTVGRLAAVVTRRTRIPNPGRILAQQFCRDEWLDGPLNRPERFELHAHKTFHLLTDLRVNSWVRIRTTQKAGDEGGQYIGIQQDMNTLAEELAGSSFPRPKMMSFFEAVGKEFGTIFELYFPSTQRDQEA